MKELIIIGAGLGPQSITLQGINELKRADIVLYDRLLHPGILDFARGKELVQVGKTPYKHCIRQDEINDLIKKCLSEGKIVARLKGGDSTVFARSIEEIEAAEEMGADVMIVPGVTSAATLSAKMRAALTDRRTASGVVFITGHPKNGEIEDTYNWKALAGLGLSIVIYMGVKNAPRICRKLVEFGMSELTSVMIGEKLETEQERLFRCTLGTISETIEGNMIENPATIVIGDVG
ncbi:uroporphyrin-III C-methyltransferase [Denitrovibrio acetiphilus DSM 12809]|uniref:uroporphyrinogen-III C-methyltransferase n=1 Tax=Denitrovibrio acetiphilus (strain DSM 12809 / NBRC 114555 / N2460) TaxID=522772 RepID=D4H1Z8_DENA2|nr:uroporphyrinogen-III C-methyltransferase [Denitrovibrio acetiphilus]ADD66975.1 uroporphyrin-III C-methyltransferase [Denitrovibrio acetiphilus DSM 12809]